MQRPTPHPRCYDIVAQISKTKGLDGQLVALEWGGLSVLHPALEVWVVPPALEGVRHTAVTEVQESKHKSGVLIKLKDVDDRTQAEKLVGRFLLARSEESSARKLESLTRQSERPVSHSERPDCHFECSEESSISDSTAPHNAYSLNHSDTSQRGAKPRTSDTLIFTDTSYGDLGVLTEIKVGPAYDIWVIEGPHGVLEIPAVDAYITQEGDDAITLTLPAGFIEITRIHKEGDNRDAD